MTGDDDEGPSYDQTLTPDAARAADADDVAAAATQQSGEETSGATNDGTLPGYAIGRRIGAGGMGEIVMAHDAKIGRDVAIKRLRSAKASPNAVLRFLREARIQARLEHPSIVPVHEVGADASGQPYFTMKRLTGVTLAARLKSKERVSLQQLLRTFIDVCQAIDFAHARGVIHRDLKPANIMLGDFGEVHVIDWGVARVIDEAETHVAVAGDMFTLDGQTEAGTVLGTPGYMAPEQLERASEVTPAADVYALGAILFELLAGEPLHPRGLAAVKSTLVGADGSPSRRAPDRAIAPELEAITAAALAQDPEARPRARELADAVQRYLDGDRDVARRKELGAAELATARTLFASNDVTKRAEAIRAAGRALALDPESRDAAELITRLMLEPPPEQPAELAASLATSELEQQQRQGRVAVKSQIAVLVFLAAATLSGLRDAGVLLVIAGWAALMLVIAFAISRRFARPNEMWVIAIGNAILGAMLSRLFGPLIVAPVVACIMAVSLTSYPQLIQHARVVVGLLVCSWLSPVALEKLGVLDRTWQVVEGAVISTSHVVNLGGPTTAALLIGGNVMAIIVIGMFSNALAKSRREAQRTTEIQAWHLKQLLPAGASR